MQELWLEKLGWDTQVSQKICDKWVTFNNHFSSIPTIKIPRWINSSTNSTMEIHGFSDASQLAMAAAVFIKVHISSTSRITLLCAKSKVAPLKRLTIPRLELNAALLLAKLINHCQKILNLSNLPVYMWTDSTVSLTWIQSHPSRWTDYVRNRVSTIQDLTPNGHWRFISGKENPADCATRGLTPTQLKDHQLWWSGPSWLQQDSTSWPQQHIKPSVEAHQEEKPGLSLFSRIDLNLSRWQLMDKSSNLNKLLRVTAICFRFRDLIKKKPNSTLKTSLNSTDLDHATNYCIKETQRVHFASELRMIRTQQNWPSSHPFARLTARLDTDGILRVGGRLENAPVQEHQKHPAILPRKSSLSSLIIADAHQRTMHGGTQLTLSTIRQRYWIIGGRQPVRTHILRCVTCARHRGLRAHQLMGQLPIS